MRRLEGRHVPEGPWCAWMMAVMLLATGVSQAETAGTPAPGVADASLENAATLGRVWGLVKYAHPALAFRNVDWDGALVRALPQAMSARTPEALAEATNAMLRHLEDPLTRVEREETPPSYFEARPAAPDPLSRWSGDVLVLDLDRRFANVNELFPEMTALGPDLAKARRVLVDLRASGPDEVAWMGMALGFLERSLPSEAVTAPAERFRVHSGFPVQFGPSSGGYTSSVETRLARTFTPAPGAPRRSIAFLVNGRTPMSPLMLALRSSPRTFLVAEGPLDDASAVQVRHVSLPGGYRAVVRASELVFPPGTPGLRPDVTVPVRAVTTGADPALQAALRLLRTDAPRNSARATRPSTPLPIGGPDNAYEAMAYPTAPYRLLAVIRFWNVMRFFHPDPKALGGWDAVLPTFLGRARDASDASAYTQTLYALAAQVDDGHIFLAEGGVPLRSLAEANAPLVLRSIEGRFIVTELPAPEAARAAGIAVGDELVAVDGRPVAERAKKLGTLLSASTPAAKAERIASLLLAGANDSHVEVMFQSTDGRMKEARFLRAKDFLPFLRPPARVDTPWRKLAEGTGYADLRLLRAEQVPAMLEAMKDTRALVLDLRGYPQGSAWALAPRLNVRGATRAALISRPRVSAGEPSEVRFQNNLPPSDGTPPYRGRVILLVDERTLSQGEYTTMMLQAASGATLVGTPTAGAVGDTTNVCLPGAICVLFTGQRFESPEGRAIQGVGLIPDVQVRPTVRGLRAGRDEVLERALTLLRESPATLREPPLAAGAP